MSEQLANDAEKRDAAVFTAVTSVSFIFVESRNVGISHVLGYEAFFPS